MSSDGGTDLRSARSRSTLAWADSAVVTSSSSLLAGSAVSAGSTLVASSSSSVTEGRAMTVTSSSLVSTLDDVAAVTPGSGSEGSGSPIKVGARRPTGGRRLRRHGRGRQRADDVLVIELGGSPLAALFLGDLQGRLLGGLHRHVLRRINVNLVGRILQVRVSVRVPAGRHSVRGLRGHADTILSRSLAGFSPEIKHSSLH